jgi:hypothetical protein
MKIALIIIPILLAAVLLGYFALIPQQSNIVGLCVAKCKQVVASGVDVSAGPCLSNEIAPDWVCDMVHNPRIPIDNLPDNECSAFVKGSARHFVEVDLNCTVVRVY